MANFDASNDMSTWVPDQHIEKLDTSGNRKGDICPCYGSHMLYMLTCGG
jgi:hypothetical protein